jgi:hypothetical protein
VNVGYNIVAFDKVALEPVNKELIVALVVVKPKLVILLVAVFENVGYRTVIFENDALLPTNDPNTVSVLVIIFEVVILEVLTVFSVEVVKLTVSTVKLEKLALLP